MSTHITTMTQRRQVTIPAEVLRVLGLKPRDRVAFSIEGSQVTVKPVEFTLETAFGAVKPLNRPEDFDQIAQSAKDEHVDHAIEKMRSE